MNGKLPESGEPMGDHLDWRLALLLSVVVLAAAIGVTVVMFAPTGRDAVIASLTRKGEEILAAAQSYPQRAPLWRQVDSTAAASGDAAVSSATVEGPFSGLRFDRIGYFDHLSDDARTLYTEAGQFSLQVSPDGSTFTLTALGPEDISLSWPGTAHRHE